MKKIFLGTIALKNIGFGEEFKSLNRGEGELSKYDPMSKNLMDKWAENLASEIDRSILEKMIREIKKEEKLKKQDRTTYLGGVINWLKD